MKLSLTAIAALFAATLHSTVATGTRAASSNGNTNAAEAKPDRDLEDVDLGNIEDVISGMLGDLDETMDEAIDGSIYWTGASTAIKAGVATDAFADMMIVHKMTRCIMQEFGERSGSAWFIWLTEESTIGWFLQHMPEHMGVIVKSFAADPAVMTELELRSIMMSMPEARRDVIWMGMKDACALQKIKD